MTDLMVKFVGFRFLVQTVHIFHLNIFLKYRRVISSFLHLQALKKKKISLLLLGNGITIPFQLLAYFQTGRQSQEEMKALKTNFGWLPPS